MIANGNATVHVSDLGAAIRFYSETLGLKLTNRFGERWATVETTPSYWTTDAAHAGLIIGLRPSTAPGEATVSSRVAPGTRGGVGYGLETYRPCEEVIAEFAKRGVRVTSDIIRFDAEYAAKLIGSDFAYSRVIAEITDYSQLARGVVLAARIRPG